MSEKKAKELRREENLPMGEFRIVFFTNRTVQVHGPINNLSLFVDVMAEALKAVNLHVVQNAQARILKPAMQFVKAN